MYISVTHHNSRITHEMLQTKVKHLKEFRTIHITAL